jgi:hypothetical protein
MKADELKQKLCELIAWGKEIYETKYEDCILGCTKDYIRDTQKKDEWDMRCLMLLQTHYPNHPQTKYFEKLCSRGISRNYGAENCHIQISILNAFADENPPTQSIISKQSSVKRLCKKFMGFWKDILSLLHILVKFFIKS